MIEKLKQIFINLCHNFYGNGGHCISPNNGDLFFTVIGVMALIMFTILLIISLSKLKGEEE